MQMTGAQRKTRLAAAAVAAVAAFSFVAVPVASAVPAATQKATSTCWLKVVNDWLAHGSVTGYYAIPCYTQAVQHLSQYPDIKQYSSAIDDIKRALLTAIRQERGNGGQGGSSGPTGSSGGGGGGGGSIGGGGGGTTGGGGAAAGGGLLHRLAAHIGPGNAQSIPLPLLVLGGLAVLLLLTAAATWLTRRMQARRITPAPATARASSSVRPKA
jgi:hypothetical protein